MINSEAKTDEAGQLREKAQGTLSQILTVLGASYITMVLPIFLMAPSDKIKR